MSIPIVVLAGRTNTGKSRLYNALCGRPEALTSSIGHLTRDWRQTSVDIGGTTVCLSDSAGMSEDGDPLSELIIHQTRNLYSEADLFLLLVDASQGLLPDDGALARELRRCGKPVVLVINKMDTIAGRNNWSEFSELGFSRWVKISAERHQGLDELCTAMVEALPAERAAPQASSSEEQAQTIVVCGLSNSGKSTLINRLSTNQRLLVHDQPGTTREPIGQRITLGQDDYQVYDTCGFSRRGDVLQYLADKKTERLVDQTDLVFYLIDVTKGLVRTDMRKLTMLVDAGQNPLLLCNKADLLNREQRQEINQQLADRFYKLSLPYAPFWISAREGLGIKKLLGSLPKIHQEVNQRFATNLLTRILTHAVSFRPPPTVDSRRIRLRYAHQGGKQPLLIVIHGKQCHQLNQSYLRYLRKCFGQELDLHYSIPRLTFQTDHNPYAKPMRS